MTDDYRYQAGLLRVTNGIAQAMAPGPDYGFWGIAVSPTGKIYVSADTEGANTTIREYDLGGNLLQANMASGPNCDVLAFGRGGSSGTDLCAMSTGGPLYRFDTTGHAALIGTGFREPVEILLRPVGTGRASGISIFDASGRRIRNLNLGSHDDAVHTISWDGLNAARRPSAAGTYFIRAEGPGVFVATRIVRTRSRRTGGSCAGRACEGCLRDLHPTPFGCKTFRFT